MKKIVWAIILFLLIPAGTAAEETGDFGEEDRNVSEFLDLYENENQNSTDDTEPAGTFSEEENNENEAGAGAHSPNLFFIMLQLLLALGAVLFGIYALLKFINKRARNFSSHSTVQSVGGIGVGTNRSVQLVKVGDRLLVVGVGDSVNLLKEIDDPAEIKALMEKNESPQDLFDQSASKLTGWLKQKKDSRINDSSPFHSLLDREMTEVKKTQTKVHSVLEEKER
ncbi:flagellar biosynthetic protein FliO [Salipaludibacillus sp. CUR1]|uniref:flagellar biosynthetic protein FliO n=1 Tax=Salipaludibacillus sp. CUR1 TaxID=2820003 RepID=UPI001E2DF3CB|nr:flagellar biosynthetic protein FliO [Salipaludibacillus sp. CUR1]MCE7794593.1 flagellar biosynthetic protein FliO [Salipaludibacillus sp. CUR1]